MFILLQLLCYSSVPERDITMFQPETEDNKYKLIKYKHKEYDNLFKCFESEVIKVNEKMEKSIITMYNYFYEKVFVEGGINERDFKPFLVDAKNDLTEDEKFAILLNIVWVPENCPFFDLTKELRDTLSKGETGHFNCFFEYIFNGLMKIKPAYDESHKELYRGTLYDPEDVYLSFLKLNKGDILKSRSFTNATFGGMSSINDYVSNERNVIFRIAPNFKNARIIQPFTPFLEKQYIYLPGAEFQVKDAVKNLYCRTENDFDDCQDEKTTEYNKEYRIIELQEIGESITKYDETESPFSSYGIKAQVSFWLLSIICFFGFFLI